MPGDYDAVVTDPPYGMSYEPIAKKHTGIANDGDIEMLRWACTLTARHSKYIFCRWDNIPDVPMPRSCITWVKNNWSMGDLKHAHGRQTEVALFYPGEDHFFPNGRPPDVLMAARTGNAHHPTEKPVDLMERVVLWTDGRVFDPFMGSGTTGVACAKLGRQFVGTEIDPTHFDTACRRIEDAIGRPSMFRPRRAVALAAVAGLFEVAA
ncbi:MAG: site-specific DNA-methyltransferase [Xanthobacteraceae bacterium]